MQHAAKEYHKHIIPANAFCCFHRNEPVTTVQFGVLLLAGRHLVPLLLSLDDLPVGEELQSENHLPESFQGLQSTGSD